MACAPNLLICFLYLVFYFFLYLYLYVRVALKLRSLRIHSPHLCRLAVFSVQTNVSLTLVSLKPTFLSSLPPFVSRRGLSNTNQRLSLLKRETDQRECALARNFIYRTRPHWEPPKRPKWWQGKNRKKEGKGAPVSQARAHVPRQPRHSGGQVSGEGDSLDLEWRDYD